jgi:glycine/D-amino acid oxidase-like deaminating enzyme
VVARTIGRRQVLAGGGVLALGGALAGCAGGLVASRGRPSRLELTPLQARADRITRMTVCTRPFRPMGPRIETERVGDKLVVHNYGHGGSGWSLSWGSASIAAELALGTGQKDIAVIGCGAIGLTTATALQRAGARVTIYAKELPPNVRSSLATGVWTPDSRICFDEFATPAFKQRWERMARTSFDAFQAMLGLPGDPIQFFDSYFVADEPRVSSRGLPEGDPRPRFAELQRELVPDLLPAADVFPPGTHSLGARRLRRAPTLMFNLTAYAHLLLGDFAANGGRIEITEFHAPSDLARIREKTLVHATGYGARQLFGDDSLVPVRGQLARTPPEEGIDYGLIYRNAAFVPRRDGFVFQIIGDDDYYGFDDATTAPDRAEAELAVNTIARLFAPA